MPGLSLFWSAFWSFSLAIGARKSFSRLYLAHYPILGRFLSQFEAPIGRGETGALRGIGGGGGKGGKGRGGGGGAKHSGRVVPELVPEIVLERTRHSAQLHFLCGGKQNLPFSKKESFGHYERPIWALSPFQALFGR